MAPSYPPATQKAVSTYSSGVKDGTNRIGSAPEYNASGVMAVSWKISALAEPLALAQHGRELLRHYRCREQVTL